MTTFLTSTARLPDSRGKRLANSPGVDLVRRALQVALPKGAQIRIAAATDRSPCRIAHQIEGANALTLDVFVASLASLPESERVRISRLALAPASLYPASLSTSPRLLPAITPAVASVFPTIGVLAEAAALAEADGAVTEDEAAAIRDEAERATATLAAVVQTAEVAAGRRLA